MPTIRDVAASAGVAPSTVSSILSGKKKFPAATVERVMASIAELQYRPDPAARALALGRTNILGFLASVSNDAADPDVDVFMRFVRSAVYTARQRGFDVLLMGKGSEELEGDMLVDALVVMDILVDDARLPLLRRRGLPTVLVGVPPDAHGMSAFDLDWSEAAHLSVRHLAELGHRHIVCLAPPEQTPGPEFAYHVTFRNEFIAEAEILGVDAAFRPVERADVDLRAWIDGVRAESPATAVVVLGVASLDALLRRAHQHGVSIPDDLSILAIAPAEEFARSFPAITVVDIPGGKMVELAVNRALDEFGGTTPGIQELLPAVLIDRGSTAPPAEQPARL